jgi:DNA repair exonuclease SbcCD ATPase subunit
MEKKDIVIIVLVLAIYLYYQQTQPQTLPIQPDNKEISELKNQVQHYQTLYQKRVAKDLEADQSAKIKELTQNNQQLTEEFQSYKFTTETKQAEIVSQSQQIKTVHSKKIKDLESQLLDLAKRKIKGKKEAEKLIKELESNWEEKKLE